MLNIFKPDKVVEFGQLAGCKNVEPEGKKESRELVYGVNKTMEPNASTCTITVIYTVT